MITLPRQFASREWYVIKGGWMYLSKVIIARAWSRDLYQLTRDYGIYFQTDRMLLVIFFSC